MTKKLAQQFLDYVNTTGSPYHSVQGLKNILLKFDFQQLNEGAPWDVKPGGKYYFTRNFTSIVAFVVGNKFKPETGGFLASCGHTDSPVLHLRPNSNMKKQGIFQLSLECYGGGLWNTWFDRGLGVAGKVIIKNGDEMTEKIVRINKPIAVVPSLPIHLRSAEERNSMKLNTETHIHPVIATYTSHSIEDFANSHISPVLLKVLAKELVCEETDITDVDLCMMDSVESRFCGYEDEFIDSPRLDNLGCTWTLFSALADSSDNLCQGEDIYMAVGFDHEEVGSMSYSGAFSSMMKTTMENILFEMNFPASIFKMVPRSFIVSADMGHAFHPNYPEKYQSDHLLHFNKGVCLKSNSQQKYTTTHSGAALFKHISEKHQVPVQTFVVRNDSPCGSTIGPMLSSALGMRSIDVGIPQLAMHSIREMCATADIAHHYNFIKGFYESFREFDQKFTTLDQSQP